MNLILFMILFMILFSVCVCVCVLFNLGEEFVESEAMLC